MSRSLKKGPYVDQRLLKKIAALRAGDKMIIKTPKQWDKKWRIVMFDIPERLKRLRNSLRWHFREIGLIELQKSVFVHPYPCDDEIEFIVEFYNSRRYVRFVVAERIDSELHLRKKFDLL